MRLEYFQMVDRIVELDLDARKITAAASVPTESTIFEGHFPGYPLMPGTLLMECMAQTSGWLVTAIARYEQIPFLVAIKEAKFRTFVKPGERLAVTARIDHEGGGYSTTRASVSRDGKLICEADLTLRLFPFPSGEFNRHVLDLAVRVGLNPPKKALADG